MRREETPPVREAEDSDDIPVYGLFLLSCANLSDVTIETDDHKASSVGDRLLQSGQSLSELGGQETCSLRYGRITSKESGRHDI